MIKVNGRKRSSAVPFAPHTVFNVLKNGLQPAFKGDQTQSFTSWPLCFEVALQATTSPDADSLAWLMLHFCTETACLL